ncbi:SDR family NAD(P)-dependent oxidoreductase [Edaphobacter bradus]|uniref:SDR family NAD(P)-dependent oxidoreductase n=1 Tax=Edaphobacter bradus TaxID=2259016 RepID=UPI0021E0ADF0|nr:glucose 1-dehydrogenase [Edaphobacter bradus]
MAALTGKVAVITGGNSGIGLATAKRFVQEGAYVFITGRRKPELDKAVAEIGKSVTAFQGDVSNLDDLDRLYKLVAETKGKIDIIFANAGIVEPLKTTDVTPEHFDKTFDINARGAYFTVQKAIPFLNDGASIILNGSGAWQKGIPIYSTYSATKAALRSFVRTWAAEFGSRGIRANVISPGPIETPILDSQFPTKEAADALRENFKTQIPLGRIGNPEEVASAAVFLASKESSYISGIDLPVDGGLVSV